MERIKRNNWYVDGNKLYMSLENYHVIIDFVDYFGELEFVVTVFDKSHQKRQYPFPTLKKAIYFVEEVVTRCDDIDKLVVLYDGVMTDTLSYMKDWRSYGSKK